MEGAGLGDEGICQQPWEGAGLLEWAGLGKARLGGVRLV